MPLALLLLQAPGDGWVLAQATPREVHRLYWDLFQVTEVWTRLEPPGPNAEAPLVHLVFQAFFPGRAERDPYTGQPRPPAGPPARMAVRAQPFPLTVVRALSLEFVVDGATIDLTAPGTRHHALPCALATEECAPTAVEADLDVAVLRSLATGRGVTGTALGLPFRLSQADHDALAEFVDRIGLGGETGPRD